MLQLSNTDMLEVLLIRCDAFREMYDLALVFDQVKAIVKASEQGESIDPRVAKNINEIKIISQILSIIEDDIAYLEEQFTRKTQQQQITPRDPTNRSLMSKNTRK